MKKRVTGLTLFLFFPLYTSDKSIEKYISTITQRYFKKIPFPTTEKKILKLVALGAKLKCLLELDLIKDPELKKIIANNIQKIKKEKNEYTKSKRTIVNINFKPNT